MIREYRIFEAQDPEQYISIILVDDTSQPFPIMFDLSAQSPSVVRQKNFRRVQPLSVIQFRQDEVVGKRPVALINGSENGRRLDVPP